MISQDLVNIFEKHLWRIVCRAFKKKRNVKVGIKILVEICFGLIKQFKFALK